MTFKAIVDDGRRTLGDGKNYIEPVGERKPDSIGDQNLALKGLFAPAPLPRTCRKSPKFIYDQLYVLDWTLKVSDQRYDKNFVPKVGRKTLRNWLN